MSNFINIDYTFEFSANSTKSFHIALDPLTLRIETKNVDSPPSWTRLEYNRCCVCKLDIKEHQHCPIALNLVGFIEEFKDYLSHQEVNVVVKVDEREYVKRLPLQFGLSSLLGAIMVSSGCPTMELLKPNLRFHLPFASIEETVYRSFTMFLLAQFYKYRKGIEVDFDLAEFEKIFTDVGKVNKAFSERLREASTKDASINALVNLHCLGEMTPMTVSDILDEIEQYYTAHLE